MLGELCSVEIQASESVLRPAQLVSRQTWVGVEKVIVAGVRFIDVKIRPQTQSVPLVRKPSVDAPWQVAAAQS